MGTKKRALKQEAGVVLLEIAVKPDFRKAGAPGKVTYLVDDVRSTKLCAFDDLNAALPCFDEAVKRYRMLDRKYRRNPARSLGQRLSA